MTNDHHAKPALLGFHDNLPYDVGETSAATPAGGSGAEDNPADPVETLCENIDRAARVAMRKIDIRVRAALGKIGADANEEIA